MGHKLLLFEKLTLRFGSKIKKINNPRQKLV